jgi:hypothetical protein
LYRAVGVASGALLLSSGVAHAEAASEAKPAVDPQAMRGLLADLFTPTGGQHHLGLSIATESASGQREELLPGLGLIGGLTGGSGSSGLVGSLTGGLTGSGSSGLLGGLTGGLTGGGPLGGLTGGDGPLGGLTGGLTGANGPLGAVTNGLSGTPLSGFTGGLAGSSDPSDFAAIDRLSHVDMAVLQDLAAANGGRLGIDGPASTDIVDPVLLGSGLDTSNQRPVLLDPAIARQVNDVTGPVVNALIADAAQQVDPSTESIEEGLPVVGDLPLVGPLVGPGGPLSQFVVVGSLFDNLPMVGDLTKGGGLDLAKVDNLPMVGKVLNQGIIQADGPSLPVVGSLPFVGKALDGTANPLSNLGQGSPLGALTEGPLGSLTQGALGLSQSPTANLLPAPVAVPIQTQIRTPAQRPAMTTATEPAAAPAASGDHVGKHRAPTSTTRPVVVDPEYRDVESLPLLGDLAGGGGMGNLPVSSLVRQLPVVSELPLVTTLEASLSLVRALPVVGTLTSLVPVENG